MSRSGEEEVKANCFKKIRSNGSAVGNELSPATGDESDEFKSEDLEDVARQKVICLPEVMEKILGYLDVVSLKQARIVCKPWLLVAQVHMERSTIVRLITQDRFNTKQAFQLFKDTCKRKLPDLPMPFQAVHVLVSYAEGELLGSIVHELFSLPPPLVITRLDTEDIRPNDVIPLIARLSSSLEYLRLRASHRWEQGGEIHPLDPNQQFLKLRHINLEALWSIEDNGMAKFLTFAPWLVSSSPNLETYELNEWMVSDMEFMSALVMQVDIRGVKAFRFRCDSDISDDALSHLISIPFRRLEALELNLPPEATWAEDAIIGVVATCCMTLKKLDLSDVGWQERDQARFPVCPNVQQLRLKWFPGGTNFVPTYFPSLQTMGISSCSARVCNARRRLNIPITPFLGLKSLRIKDVDITHPDQCVVKLFENFPFLERLDIDDTNFMFGCSLVSKWMPKSVNFLKRVKHLEVCTNSDWSCKDFIGLESIRVITFEPEIITTLPVKEFPRLKVVQFRWDDSLDLRKLLEMTRGVEKVLITNCCSVQRWDDSRSKDLLKSFFESAPNAQCGCGTTGVAKPQWFPGNTFIAAAEDIC